jgi:carbonic anhydrase/acetyltransferase-like protein (isoleucine patch superfamily)
VEIGAQSSVWFHAVIRADSERVRIGRQTNIQDGAVLHADPGFPCLIGDQVTVGHRAVVHGAQVADRVLIGIGAVVLNGATLGEGSIVGAAAVVPEDAVIPPTSVVLGIPAKVRRQATDADRQRITHAAEHYVLLAARYRAAGL